MARTFKDPNPHISILDDPATKRKIAALAEHALDQADQLKSHPLSPEQMEREQWQAESNEYASQNPLYAAARSISHLVLPLAPGTADPLVDPSQATMDSRKLYEWWQLWSDANPGVILGRRGGLFALRVEDAAAWERLRAMAKVEQYDKDIDRHWIEYREIGGVIVRLLAPSEPVSIRSRMGWGRDFGRAMAKEMREEQERQPQTFFLLFSFPSPASGQDVFNYPSHRVLPGVEVMGEGSVLPWDGSILEGGIRVAGPNAIPMPAPLWLSKIIGKPRSRKAVEAARDSHEAALRMVNARSLALEAQLRILEEEARAKAEEDRRKAERLLADEMAKG